MEQVTEQLAVLLIPQLWVRLLCAGICIVLLAFFVNPMLLGIRHAGCYTGIVVCVLGAIFFLFNPQISRVLTIGWHNPHGRIAICIVAGFLAVCVLFAAIVSIGMVRAIHRTPKEESTVVVLGCKVRGKQPSLMLRRRLDAAYDYLQAHPDVPVIVCGGQGADEEISEAQCMAEYLEEKGISENRIWREDKSVSTRENLTFARDILEAEDREFHVTIVTDGFHELRASCIAKDVGLAADSVPAKTPWYLAPSYWVREWLGMAQFLIFG